MDTDAQLAQYFAGMWPHLDEHARRVVAASKAGELGYGGISRVSRACGLSRVTLIKGVAELQAAPLAPGRVRREGGGRHALTSNDPGLAPALDGMVEPTARGDPQSPLRWTCKSARTLAAELTARRHPVSHTKVTQLLREDGYSLQGNRKTEEGGDHPDRDAQFRHINRAVKHALRAGEPVISVDTKKKELIGNYQNQGRQWRQTGTADKVNGHDFPGPEVPRAYPYGIYDLARAQRRLRQCGHGPRHGCVCGGFDPRLVARRGSPPVPARAATPDHRRWRWEQRLAPAPVEMGVAAPGRPDGADVDGLPFPSGHEQMEQGGAPVVFLHLVQLARRAAARLRDGGAPDRRDDDGQGIESDLPFGPPQVPCRTQDHG